MKPCDHDSYPLYKRLIGPLREKAREMGYALTVHGSLKRDIDLVAIPWTDQAVDARTLAHAIRDLAEQINGQAYWSWHLCDRRGPFSFPGMTVDGVSEAAFAREFTLDGAPGNKPHGRLGWVINLGNGPYIDLAVMPQLMCDPP